MATFNATFNRIDRAVARFMGDHAIWLLRVALGTVYVWFGALKLFNVSPVSDLVVKTVYYVPPQFAVPLLGLWEIAIGLGLLFRLCLRSTLFLLFVQLAGTLSLPLLYPHEAFDRGNPLLLTQTGEFVVKNLVLIAAGLAIGSTVRRSTEEIRS